MSQACPERLGEIGAYIVGALDQGAEADLRRHLAACSGCRAEYEDLLPVRDWLGRLDSADAAASTPQLRPVPTFRLEVAAEEEKEDSH